MFRSKAERKVADAGYDPARLPPGQYLTEKWPVLHAGTVPKIDLATWDFRVWGEVENPVRLTWQELQRLPSTEITADIHCVTRWSRFDTSFRGVHWRDLAELVQPKPSAQFVVAHAEQGFTANVPLAALDEENALIAYEADGEPLTLSYEELQALPQSEITVDIHCVTRWSRFDTSFRGVHWRELAKLVRPRAGARFLVAHAEQGFTSNVPLTALEADDSLIAWEADGEPLAPEHGWPLRLVVASRYFWKSAKWLRGLELRTTDEPGFWERYGYHNEADFRREQRYSF